MADKKDPLSALDRDDSLTVQTERNFEENTGNEGCGYDSARGSNCLPDGEQRSVGSELAEAVEESLDKAASKVKAVLGTRHDET